MLGFDPLYKACVGRVLAIFDSAYAQMAIENLHKSRYWDAAIIGRIETGYAYALIETKLGGESILQEPEEDPLPCIC